MNHGRMKIHYNGILYIHFIVYITLVLIWRNSLMEDCIDKEGKKSKLKVIFGRKLAT